MELAKNELSLILELVGMYACDLDEALRKSENALEPPTVLEKRLEEADALYRKVFQEIYGK